jgi:signal transduction histidine kinase
VADLRPGRRLTLRILLAASLAATLGVGFADVFWTLFFMSEIRTQVTRHTQDVVKDNEPRCRSSPATFGRDREVGRFDAYDASTLRSENPRSPPPDPVLVAALRRGVNPAPRVYWGGDGALGGAVLEQVGASGPCTLFQLQWFAPRGFGAHLALLLLSLALLAVAATGALSAVLVVRPLAGRLARLRLAAERIGEPLGYEPEQDLEWDEIGELSRILDRAHERIRSESTRLHSRAEVLERHLAEVAHDLRTPLTSIQIGLEQVVVLAEDRAVKDLVRRALTDTVYTSELTENLRLAAQLQEGVAPEALDVDLTALVERVVGRFALLGKHRGVKVETALPGRSLKTVAPPLWVEQAVANVLHNAVTRGGEAGHVAVLLEADGTERFRLTVLDDGPGRTAAGLQGLGEGIFRADLARRRDPPGSGLGLTVTAEICRRSGWTLSFPAQARRGLGVRIEGGLVAGAAQPREPIPPTGSEVAAVHAGLGVARVGLPSSRRLPAHRRGDSGAQPREGDGDARTGEAVPFRQGTTRKPRSRARALSTIGRLPRIRTRPKAKASLPPAVARPARRGRASDGGRARSSGGG